LTRWWIFPFAGTNRLFLEAVVVDIRTLLRDQYQKAHGMLAPSLEDCSPEVLHALLPRATVGSIGAIYAHAVIAEDVFTNKYAFHKEPLYTEYEPRLKGVPHMENGAQTPEWTQQVKLDLPSFKPYAEAVFAATDAGIAALSDEDLEREVNFGGPIPLAGMLGIFVQHYSEHCGEIAALKGAHGLQGLPF
jgi:hypothetical protein